jgi:hypothetical protein
LGGSYSYLKYTRRLVQPHEHVCNDVKTCLPKWPFMPHHGNARALYEGKYTMAMWSGSLVGRFQITETARPAPLGGRSSCLTYFRIKRSLDSIYGTCGKYTTSVTRVCGKHGMGRRSTASRMYLRTLPWEDAQSVGNGPNKVRENVQMM